MHLTFGNVEEAFKGLVYCLHTGALPVDVQPSRYGEVIRVLEPVTLTYQRPLERVLFNAVRDANPLFHMYESLWMLAGRNDVAPLAYYNKRMAEFSDDGTALNDAYGRRWRHASYGCGYDHYHDPKEADQLDLIVAHLTANPHSRRAVLEMWNVEDDLLKIDNSKGVCCNLSVMFDVGFGTCAHCNGKGLLMAMSMFGPDYSGPCPRCHGKPHDVPRHLNMTVINRSNDLVWGLLGANYVQFTVLQEYMAARLGLEVGVYNHFTNNLHAYTAPGRWDPEAWLAWYNSPDGEAAAGFYADGNRVRIPLVDNPAVFEEELPAFVDQAWGSKAIRADWSSRFLMEVALPARLAFAAHKDRLYDEALGWCNAIQDSAWRLACWHWIKRRQQARHYKAREVTSGEA
jgi:thymidylate synthase